MGSTRLPGVVSTIQVNQTLGTPTTAIRKPIILGVGDVKVLVENERVVRGVVAGGNDALANTIYGASDALRLASILRIGNSPNSADYTKTNNYIVTTASDITYIDWSPGTEVEYPADNYTEPAVGQEYYITYYKTLENFDLVEYYGETDIKAAHGDAIMSVSKQYATVTAVSTGAPKTTFEWANTETVSTPVTDWTISFTTGTNAGLTRTVSTYTPATTAANGTFVVYVAFPNDVTIGDIFLAQDSTPVVNTLSAGALLALRNGASSVIVGQLDNTGWTDTVAPSASQYTTALNVHLESLKTYLDVPFFIVPMLPHNATTFTTNTIVNSNAISPVWNHCKLMSTPENKGERTCVAGYLAVSTKANFKAFATSFFSTRAIVTAPGDIVFTDVLGTTVNGSLSAAALAGRICSYARISQSVLRESLSGIDVAANFYNPIEQRDLTSAGITFLISDFGVVRIIAGKTTDTASADTEDIAVVAIADYVKKATREELDATFIGAPINDRLLNAIRGKLFSTFDRLMGDQILETYKKESITVRQDLGEPRLIKVTGSIKPQYSLWFISLDFSFYV